MWFSKEWNALNDIVRSTLISHQEAVPIKLSTIGQAFGVKIQSSTLPVGISGEIRPNKRRDEYIIKVNRHDGTRRQRFTVAHELAHFLLHKDQIGDGITDDVLYRSSLSDIREAEANRLAADILMPINLVLEEKEKAEAQGIDDVVGYVADRFEVSEVAMRIRLGQS